MLPQRERRWIMYVDSEGAIIRRRFKVKLLSLVVFICIATDPILKKNPQLQMMII